MSQSSGTKRWRGLWVVAIIATLALMAGACGSEADSEVASAEPAVSSTEEAEPAATEEAPPEEAMVEEAASEPTVEDETPVAAPTVEEAAPPAEPPPNDLVANAVVIDPAALPFTVELDTTGATTDGDDRDFGCPVPAIEATVWYSITPSTTTELVVTADGTDYPAGLIISTESQESIACEPIEPASRAEFGLPPSLVVPIEADVTYHLMVLDGRPDSDVNGGELKISIDASGAVFAEPVERFPRLVSRTDDNPCPEGFVTTDGLHEFATVDGELHSLDLVTQEVAVHGPAPVECVFWLGDHERGRRVVLSLSDEGVGRQVWFGPLDGPSESEFSFDSNRMLLSRTFAANRLVFLEPDAASVIIVDATTGEPVGDAIVGGFGDSRNFVSLAVNGAGTQMAIGAANPGGPNGDGRVIVVDPENGEQLFGLDLPAPVTSVIFDDDTQELIVGSFTGELFTVDAATGSIVSEVNNSSGATIAAVGLRSDGVVVTYTIRAIELMDRQSGPIGPELLLLNSGAARVRPDGTVASWTNAGFFETYVIDG